MAPIHPPLPRSKTFGALPNDMDQPLLSTKTPSYARGTSSSQAKSRGKSPMIASTPVLGYSRRNRPSYAESATSISSTRKTPFSSTLNTPTSPRVNLATNTSTIGGSENRRPSHGGSRVATSATGNLRHQHSRYSDSGSAFASGSKPTFSSGFKSPLLSGSRPLFSSGSKSLLHSASQARLSPDSKTQHFAGPKAQTSPDPKSPLPSGSRPLFSPGSKAQLHSGSQARLSSSSKAQLQSGSRAQLPSGFKPLLPSGSKNQLSSGSDTQIDTGSKARGSPGFKSQLQSGSQARFPSGFKPLLPSGSQARLSSGTQNQLHFRAQNQFPSGSKIQLDSVSEAQLSSGSQAQLSSDFLAHLPSGPQPSITSGSRPRLSGYGSSYSSGVRNSSSSSVVTAFRKTSNESMAQSSSGRNTRHSLARKTPSLPNLANTPPLRRNYREVMSGSKTPTAASPYPVRKASYGSFQAKMFPESQIPTGVDLPPRVLTYGNSRLSVYMDSRSPTPEAVDEPGRKPSSAPRKRPMSYGYSEDEEIPPVPPLPAAYAGERYHQQTISNLGGSSYGGSTGGPRSILKQPDGAEDDSDSDVGPPVPPKSPVGGVDGVAGADPRLVSNAMPQQYWLGRFTTLRDRLKTSAMQSSLAATSANLGFLSLEDIPAPMEEDEIKRLVFLQLRDFCVSPEAEASLANFLVEYEWRKSQEDWAERGERGVVLGRKKPKGGETMRETLNAFERMVGRKRRGRKSGGGA